MWPAIEVSNNCLITLRYCLITLRYAITLLMSMDSFRGFSMFNPRNESIPIMKAKKYAQNQWKHPPNLSSLPNIFLPIPLLMRFDDLFGDCDDGI